MSKDKPVKAWKVPPGKVSLASWNIIIVKIDGVGTAERFLGLDLHTDEFRLSTNIEKYDDEKAIGHTESGSIYQLIGKPGELHP